MEVCQEHAGIKAKVENLENADRRLESVDKDQWAAIEKLQNRLPLWATIFLMVVSAVTGSALTYAALAVKLYSHSS